MGRASAGIEAAMIPPRRPSRECLCGWFAAHRLGTEVTERVLIFSARYLRSVPAEHARDYHGRQPNRSRQLRPPRPDVSVADLAQERIKRRQVLGGLINEYQRAA